MLSLLLKNLMSQSVRIDNFVILLQTYKEVNSLLLKQTYLLYPNSKHKNYRHVGRESSRISQRNQSRKHSASIHTYETWVTGVQSYKSGISHVLGQSISQIFRVSS